MDPDRSLILSQLASGEISADQAAERLRGAGAGPAGAPGPASAAGAPGLSGAPGPASAPVPQAQAALSAAANRWLRIRVTDLATGRPRVNVNLPMSWVAVGLRIGSHYSDELNHLDLPQLLSALESGAGGQLVDVEDLEDGQRVQIFVE
jgi:hypothetical protein